VPDKALMSRLSAWASNRPMDQAIALLAAAGYFDDAVFLDDCVVELDAEIAVIDWVAVDDHLITTNDATPEIRDAVRSARRVWADSKRASALARHPADRP
jgi:hypothetical protein